jgi:hypothetical protein
MVQSQPGQIVHETLSGKKKKITHKRRGKLVELLKVKALRSNPLNAKKKKKNCHRMPVAHSCNPS